MNPEDVLIGQIGLILTQTSQVRRTLEDIERAISRYSGIAFSGVLSGAHFGEPPILDGALRVYVVNIGELAPSGGIGGFFANLLGGIGGFFGGLLGGIPGGFLGGLALPYNLAQLRRIIEALRPIVDTVDAMLTRMGPSTGPSWLDRLPELTELVKALTLVLPPLTELVRALGQSLPSLVKPITDLYTLFRGPSTQATPAAPAEPPLDYVAILRELTRLVGGLVFLVPELIGGLAVIVVHLGDIRRGITDTLTWALRMVFLLRGAVLVTLFDTLAEGAGMAAQVLSVLATAVEAIITAVFNVVERSVSAAFALLRLLGSSLSGVLNTLVNWLINSLGETLRYLGEMPVFQLVFRVADALANVIRLMSGLPVTPLPAVPTGPAAGPTTPSMPAPLALAETLPQAQIDDVTKTFTDATTKSTKEIKDALGNAIGALRGLESTGREREAGAATGSETLAKALLTVDTRAKTLGDVLGQQAPSASTPTDEMGGLRTVADAYQRWLTDGGLGRLLNELTRYFQQEPASAKDASNSLLGRLFSASESGVATVEIDEMVVEVAPPPTANGTGASSDFGDEQPLTLARLIDLNLRSAPADMRHALALEAPI